MKPTIPEQPFYKETRWHLLRIGKNGSVKPFVHFQKGVILAAVLLLFMLITIGALLLLWLDAKNRIVEMQHTAAAQSHVVETVRQEKDSALTRLAIAESKLRTAVAVSKKHESPEKTSANATDQPAVTSKPEPKAAPQKVKTEVASETVKMAALKPQVQEEEIVSITEKVTADNLFVCVNSYDSRLNIEFKVINMGTRKQPVSGHVFIILKDSKVEQDRWMVLPRAMLMDGRPVESRGQRFRIYNYRTVKFSVVHENPSIFTDATIFVYKNTGELIFERDFNLEPLKECL